MQLLRMDSGKKRDSEPKGQRLGVPPKRRTGVGPKEVDSKEDTSQNGLQNWEAYRGSGSGLGRSYCREKIKNVREEMWVL